jgi:hypothetical protein
MKRLFAGIIILAFGLGFSLTGVNVQKANLKTSGVHCPYLQKMEGTAGNSGCPYLRNHKSENLSECPYSDKMESGREVCPYLNRQKEKTKTENFESEQVLKVKNI